MKFSYAFVICLSFYTLCLYPSLLHLLDSLHYIYYTHYIHVTYALVINLSYTHV